MFAAQKKSAVAQVKEVYLNLTPMIDILTCLLFFLMMGYKSQAVMLESAQNMELPPSQSEEGLVVTITVTVTESEIRLMDSPVMLLSAGEVAEADLEGSKIIPLYNRMARLLQLQKLDPENAYVLLLADRRLKSDLITKVMKTCGMAGMPRFNLGVARP